MEDKNLPTYKIKVNPDDESGVYAVSLVENPAIEVDWIHLSEIVELAFSADSDKQLLYGPLLIPGKLILRQDKAGNLYNIVFDEETIEIIANKHNEEQLNKVFNFEHSDKPVEAVILENWLTGETDKSSEFGYDLPKGTWFAKVKVKDKNFWMNSVKSGKVKGFSVEIKAGVELVNLSQEDSYELESYTDYPEAASNNAKKAIEYKEKNGSDCGTAVGWTRASQLANREPISEETINRMASFKRHQENKDVPYSEGCGGLMWDAWGGDAGIEWAIKKAEELRNLSNTNNMEKEQKETILEKIKKSSEVVETVVEDTVELSEEVVETVEETVEEKVELSEEVKEEELAEEPVAEEVIEEEQPMEEEPKSTLNPEEVMAIVAPELEAIKGQHVEIMSKVAELEAKISEMDKKDEVAEEMSALKEKVEKLSAMPASDSITEEKVSGKDAILMSKINAFRRK